MTDVELIPSGEYYKRLVRTLTRRGLVSSMLGAARAKPTDIDSFPAIVRRTAERVPSSPAIKFEGRTWTWREFDQWSNRVARVLADAGVVKGDAVALVMENRPEYLVSATAIMKVGAAVAMVNSSLSGRALEHCIEIVSPKAVIIGTELLDACTGERGLDLAPTVFAVPDGDAVVTHGLVDLAQLADGASAAPLAVVDQLTLGDRAVFIYTSGTTGLPKAAVNDHRRLRYGAVTSSRVIRRLDESDTVLLPLPLYHTSGFLGAFSACAYSGAAMAPLRRFSASKFWDQARAVDATTFSYVGEILRYLHNQPPSPGDRDHQITSALGAGLRAEIWTDFKERFGIDQVFEVYGATESPTGFLNILNFDRTCGWNPYPWKTVQVDPETEEPVRSEDGKLLEVGPGGVGLLLMKVSHRTPYSGYLDDVASEKKLLRDEFKDGDVWFVSGDLVLNQGNKHARFIDRLGDTFRWRSENVATTEVEGVANAWHEIEDGAAYGVEVPGAEGRVGMLRVTLGEGHDLDLAGFAEHLRAGLGSFAVPRFVRVGPSLDLTGSFRHKKGDLKAAGYDPGAADGDEVFVLGVDDEAFRPLTPDLVAAVADGTLRL